MKRRIAIIGCGYLGNIVAAAVKNGLLPEYELAGAMSRHKEDAEKLLSGTDGTAAETLGELLSGHPDYVIETASVAVVRECCIPVLKSGVSLIPLSVGAFAEEAFYEEVRKTAEEYHSRVYIPHGAVGGFDVLQTVSLMAEASGGEIAAGIETHKGPASLRNTPVYRSEMESSREAEAFAGTAADAIRLLPAKVNVAVASALASAGPARTKARIVSVSGFTGDDHRITAETEGVRAVLDVYSAESAIAGWSIVSLLRSLVSPVVFF